MGWVRRVERSEAERRFCAHARRRDYAPVMLWVGVLYSATALTTALVMPDPGPIALLFDAPVVALLIGGSFVVRQTWVDDRAAALLFTAVTFVLCMGMTVQAAVFHDPPGLLYVLIVLIAWGPSVGWMPAYAPLGALVAAAFIGASVLVVPADWPSWSLAALAAILGGMALLSVRVRTLQSLYRAREEIHVLAIQDRLTGLLNRHGFEQVQPALGAQAARSDAGQFVCFVDLDRFKVANDTFGHEFGDAVLQAVATGLQGAFRDADLVARWGGDEFLVYGLGRGPDPLAVRERVRGHVAASGIDPDRWPGWVTVGKAVGGRDTSLDSLVIEADADMYRQKVR